MNGPTILDGLHNSRCDFWAYFLSGVILIKHYAIVGTAESRITLLRFPKFKGNLVLTNCAIRGASSSRIMVKVMP